MAYIADNLSQTAQTIGGTHRRFTYITSDILATVTASDYFAGEERLQIGDFVDVVVTDSQYPFARTTATGGTIIVTQI